MVDGKMRPRVDIARQVMTVKFKRSMQWVLPKWPVVGGVILLVGLLIGIVFKGGEMWTWYQGNKTPNEAIAPLLTLATGAAVAWIAFMRHFATTDADRQRRITDNYSKAVDQLSSDKIETRLGGIYTLERISRESPGDYWTIMETLTAFVRERARWKESGVGASEIVTRFYEGDKPTEAAKMPPTDIAAVLTVITRRSDTNRAREKKEGWCFDLRGSDLRGAALNAAHLEGAVLAGAHLEGAGLDKAHLEGAVLGGAHLEDAQLPSAHLKGADLVEAHLEAAQLPSAHLEGANLWGAHLEGAFLLEGHLEGAFLLEAHLEGAGLAGGHLEGAVLLEAHLEGANLAGAHLDGADLTQSHGLIQAQLDTACGENVKLDPPLTIEPCPAPSGPRKNRRTDAVRST
jgi:uncharacterized protein YjbI with pentapeptide repeats